jgi:replicative DNA helicase
MFLSLEMPRRYIIAKTLSRFTAVLDKTPGKNNAKTMSGILQRGRRIPYSQAEKELIAQAVMKYWNEVKDLMLFTDSQFRKIDEIERCIETYIQQKELTPVIFIDYLQLLIPDKPYGTDKQNVDKVINSLKRLSVVYATPVFVTSSINRSSYDKAIELDSFKESGSIEFQSDVVLGLDFQKESANSEEKKKDPRQVHLKILKNRNGPLGQINFEFHAKFNLFLEKETSVNQDEQPKKIKKLGLKEAGKK